MSAYYQFINRVNNSDGSVTAKYNSTIHAQGAWNEQEQHMAPVTGILCYEIEQFNPISNMRIGRISLDIFGMIHFGEFTITTKSIRPGKTIELLESIFEAKGKICVIARAWRMITSDSSEVLGLEDQKVPHPESLEKWEGMQQWPGGFIQTIETRTNLNEHRLGKGVVWLTNTFYLVEGYQNSDFTRLMGMVDVANGVAPRQSGNFEWIFPNLDLQIHLHRLPKGAWLGLEVVQQYGDDGIGLTSAVLHDIHGPFGRSEQILTLRKV